MPGIRCNGTCVNDQFYARVDEQGPLRLGAQRCRPGHETAEEIWLSAGYRGPDPTRIRYAVASKPMSHVAVPARASAKRRAYACAGAI